MPENSKTQEFLKKLAPCMERGELDACVEEAAQLVQEMGVEAHGTKYIMSFFLITKA